MVKSYGRLVLVVACWVILSDPVPVPFLLLWIWDLRLGFGTWILDIDFGLDLGLTNNNKGIAPQKGATPLVNRNLNNN